MIHLHLLGSIDLRGPDGRPVEGLLRQPKRLALLAYLALPRPGTWHRRDLILATFWPESDTAHARTALRNALYVLRGHLGEGVLLARGDEDVALDPAKLRTDIDALREAINQGDYQAASALWRGELLDGVHPQDAGGFEPWLDAERRRLTRELRDMCQKRAVDAQAGNDITEALRATQQLLAIDPYDEPAVRRAMELLAQQGNFAGALAAYSAFTRKLQQDFAAAPSEETSALAARYTLPPTPLRAAPAGPDALPVVIDSTAPRITTSSTRRPVLLGVAAVALITAAFLVPKRGRPITLGESRPITVDEGLQIEPSLSPDGRLVAFAKGDAQRMRIHVARVDGSATWPLTTDTTSVELLPRWSPGSDEILFLSGNHAWVSPAVGGTARRVADGGSGQEAVRSASWSPRGDSVLIVRGDSLLVIPRDGPGARFIGSGEQLHSCNWSPTGGRIACVSGNWISFVPGTLFGNRAPSALVMFDARGGPPIPLTDLAHEHQSPTWSADGRYLAFLSDRDGVPGEAYRVRIGRRGRFASEPQRLGITAEFLSLSANGMAYSVPSRRSNVHAIEIPASGVATVNDAVALTRGNQLVEVLDVSRDGRWLVYDSDVRGRADLYRLPLDGGDVERLTSDPRPEFTGTMSPDGREVAFHRWVDGVRRIHVLRIEDGVTTQPWANTGDHGVPRWSPEGNAIAGWIHDREPGATFVLRRGVDGNWSPPRWILDGAQLPVWSPGGDSLAFLSLRGDVRVMSADSGAIRTWYEPRDGSDDPIATFLAWRGPDGVLWFLGHRPSGAAGIWELRPGSGEARLVADLRDPRGRTPGPSLSTDGRRWYFTLDERTSNLRWVGLR